MRELVEHLVKELVDNPDEVEVIEEPGDSPDAIYLEIYVADEDKGKIIGKRGRIANAIRAIVRAASEGSDQRAFVEIMS